MVVSQSGDEKRSWVKDIKAIIKEFQREEYFRNKDSMIREQEEREAKKRLLESLRIKEAYPTTDQNSDVWTLGLILYQMYTGKSLFEELAFAEAAVAFMTRSLPPEITEDLPEDLRDILRDCWLPNSEQRPNFSMVFDRIHLMECERRKMKAAVAAVPQPQVAVASPSTDRRTVFGGLKKTKSKSNMSLVTMKQPQP